MSCHLILTGAGLKLQELRTLAASDASSSFSSVVQESIAAAVEVETTLIFSEKRLFAFTKINLSAASVFFSVLFSCSYVFFLRVFE